MAPFNDRHPNPHSPYQKPPLPPLHQPGTPSQTTTPIPNLSPNPLPVTETETTTVAANGTPTITIEKTKSGGVSVKLPTLALIHILSMCGIVGGAYQVTKPSTAATAITVTAAEDVAQLKRDSSQSQMERAAILERLARIEANTENVKEAVREIRQTLYRSRNGGGGGAATLYTPEMPKPVIRTSIQPPSRTAVQIINP